jgi:hypothetical protein
MAHAEATVAVSRARSPAMIVRPRLVRNIPFWVLLVGSLASFGYGGFLILDKISTMAATLANGSATGVDVYVGQSWIVVGAAFIGAGLLGLVTVLALAVIRSLVAAPAASTVVEESPAQEVVAPEAEATPDADAEPAPEAEVSAR